MADNVVRNLRAVDALDFDGFSYQKSMALFREIHSPNVLVTYPEGTQTLGINDHVAKIDVLYTISADIHLESHPLAFGHENLSSMIGILAGTVSPSAVTIIPNAVVGNHFKLRMFTLNEWNEVGSFDAETLCYDNYTFIQQVTDPNQPPVLQTAEFDTFIGNSTEANYFKTPYDPCTVQKNLRRVRRLYRAINRKDWAQVETMVHQNVSFVTPVSVYQISVEHLLDYLKTLQLPTITPYVLQDYTWDTSKALYGARDWVSGVGFIQVFANGKATVSPSVPPALFPEVYPSPIPMATKTRWSDEGKLSEIHIFYDNLEIMTQLGLVPKF